MVDSGASNNFISRKLVADLGLEVDERVKFGVLLGDGCRLASQGGCRSLQIDIGSCKLQIVGYLFDLGGVDLILVIDWLRTLDEVTVDWGKMHMRFTQNDREVKLHRDRKLMKTIVSLRSLAV